MIPTIPPNRRPAWKMVHQSPPGSQVAFLPESMRGEFIAVVAHPDGKPYLVRPDGTTKEIEWREAVACL